MMSLREAMVRLSSMGDRDRARMGRVGRQIVKERFSWPVVSNMTCEMYSEMVDQGKAGS